MCPHHANQAGQAALRAMAFAVCCAALAAVPAVAAARGAVYKWTDSGGVIHYTNVANDRAMTGGGNAALSVLTETTSAVPPAHIATDLRSHSAVFKFRDGAGVVHYTDTQPQHQSFTVINVYCPACDPHSPINWDRTRLNLTAYADSIDAAAKEFSVDPALVRAIIHAESAFDPSAVSRKGAQGLMQLMPETAAEYGVANPFVATENIRAGVRHLAGLLKSFNGDVNLAAAAYDAGEGAVRKYGGVPPYEETRVYVQRVGVLHRRYQSGS
jgi:membrane-bound lytic murein transglycosylase B